MYLNHRVTRSNTETGVPLHYPQMAVIQTIDEFGKRQYKGNFVFPLDPEFLGCVLIEMLERNPDAGLHGLVMRSERRRCQQRRES